MNLSPSPHSVLKGFNDNAIFFHMKVRTSIDNGAGKLGQRGTWIRITNEMGWTVSNMASI